MAQLELDMKINVKEHFQRGIIMMLSIIVQSSSTIQEELFAQPIPHAPEPRVAEIAIAPHGAPLTKRSCIRQVSRYISLRAIALMPFLYSTVFF